MLDPLAVSLTGGHVHDVTQAQVLTQEIEPAAPLGNKGYDSDGFIEHLEAVVHLRRGPRVRGIRPRIARRGTDSSERLGRRRWVVERSLAWVLGCRGLGIGYERQADLLQGLLHSACALLCLHFLPSAVG